MSGPGAKSGPTPGPDSGIGSGPNPGGAAPAFPAGAPDGVERDGSGEKPAPGTTLLALDAGVRETGWAIFHPDRMNDAGNDAGSDTGNNAGNNAGSDTGIIRLPRSRNLDAADRVAHLVRCLDRLVARWSPAAVAYGQPSGIRWPVPSLELLDAALVNWSAGHRLPLYTYSAQEVRAAIARHAHAPRDQLAYAVMSRLGLIGQSKTTHEWEALAIGYYHLHRWPADG